MQGHAPHTSMPDSKNQLTFWMMVGAAVAVIIVSLVGVGVVTGIIPRLGADLQGNEQMRYKQDEAADRQGKGNAAEHELRSGAATENRQR